MFVRISETIRRYLGWCPNAPVIKAKSGGAVLEVRAANPVTKSPGPSGSAQSGKPRDGRYEHTQRGFLIVGAVTAAILIILASMYLFGVVWVAVLVLGILVFALAICSTLTVTAGDDALRIRFGPIGLIRKSWPMAEIASVSTVTNPWYYGWGIRWTPRGPLYNVSGYGAVEVRLLSGKIFRIGTDEPDTLVKSIRSATTPSH
jgi:hypothetical protein